MNKGGICVVEDDDDIVVAISIILEEEGYNVHVIRDGNIVAEIQAYAPRLILLDIQISGKNGVEISKELKTNHSTKNIPIILMSANRDIKQLTRKAFADDYLVKPFDIDLLIEKINQYVLRSK